MAVRLPTPEHTASTSFVQGHEEPGPIVSQRIKDRPRHHLKSRDGCSACRALRIKCGTEIPICTNCHVRGISCMYADLPQSRLAVVARTSDTVSIPLEPSATLALGMQEMRYFNYFLTRISHPLPLGNKTVWVKEIPQISHEHKYLAHAMLSYGVSQLGKANPDLQVRTEILQHRGKALAGLQKAFNNSDAWTTYGYVDAMLSTLYLLVYQSSQMPDGLHDFEIFIHGCALTTSLIQQWKLKTALKVGPDWTQERLAQPLQIVPNTLPESDLIFVRSGLHALEDVRNSAVASKCFEFWQAQYNLLETFCQSPSGAYVNSIENYGQWYHLATGLLEALKETDRDAIAILLVAYFLSTMTLINVLMPLRMWPPGSRLGSINLPATSLQQAAQWIEVIDQSVPPWAQARLTRAKTVTELFPYTSTFVQDERGEKQKLDILKDMRNKAHMVVGDILRIGSDLANWFEGLLHDKYRSQKDDFEKQR